MWPYSLLQTHFPSKETVNFISIAFSLMIPTVLYILYNQTPMIQEVFLPTVGSHFKVAQRISSSLTHHHHHNYQHHRCKQQMLNPVLIFYCLVKKVSRKRKCSRTIRFECECVQAGNWLVQNLRRQWAYVFSTHSVVYFCETSETSSHFPVFFFYFFFCLWSNPYIL